MVHRGDIKMTKLMLDRQDFITLSVLGKTLDVGTNDGSGWQASHNRLGIEFNRDNDWLTHFDCDMWVHPNMVRGDAHKLPFFDKSFDTIVFGDVMEHVVDPYIVLKEALRVAKSRVVITVPNEYVWHKSLKPFADIEEHLEEIGKTLDEEAYDNTIGHQSTYTQCVDFVPESVMPHLNHLRRFSFIGLTHLIKSSIDHLHDLVSFNTLYHPLGSGNEAPDMGYFSVIIDIGGVPA